MEARIDSIRGMGVQDKAGGSRSGVSKGSPWRMREAYGKEEERSTASRKENKGTLEPEKEEYMGPDDDRSSAVSCETSPH